MASPVHVISGHVGDHHGKLRTDVPVAEPGVACWFITNGDLLTDNGVLTALGRNLRLAIAARKPGAVLIMGEPDMRRNWFIVVGWPELINTANALGSLCDGFDAMFV